MERKTKIKFTDFECNLLVNGMNEFRNMLLAEDLPKEDVDELLLEIIKKVNHKPVFPIISTSCFTSIFL